MGTHPPLRAQLHAAGFRYRQPQPRLTSATFHSFCKPQGQFHSWVPRWTAPDLPSALHKPYYKHPQMECILLSPLLQYFTSITRRGRLSSPSPRSTADEVRKKQQRPRMMTIHQNVNEFLKILVLSSRESINSFALLLCLKVSLTQRCGK